MKALYTLTQRVFVHQSSEAEKRGGVLTQQHSPQIRRAHRRGRYKLERPRNRIGVFVCLFVLAQLFAATAEAEDGYRLWLRYDPLPAESLGAYRARVTSVVVQGRSPTLDAIRTELVNGLTGLLGRDVP